MKCAIVGDRECPLDINMVEVAVKDSGFTITEIVSGGASGADTLARLYAKKYNIKFTEFKPNWKDLSHPDAVIKTNKFGKYDAAAGIRRNTDIVNYVGADGCCIALQPNGLTYGTQDTVSKFKALGASVYIYSGLSKDEVCYSF